MTSVTPLLYSCTNVSYVLLCQDQERRTTASTMTSQLRHICSSIADFALMSYAAIGRYHDDDVPLKPTHPSMGEGEGEEGGMNESSLSIVNRALYYETTMTGISPISKSTTRWAQLEWKLKNHLEQIGGDPTGSSPNVRSRRCQSDQGKTLAAAENDLVSTGEEDLQTPLTTGSVGGCTTRVRRSSASLIEAVLQEIGTTTSKQPSSPTPQEEERRSEFACRPPQKDDGGGHHFDLRSRCSGASSQLFQAFSDDVDVFDDDSFHSFWVSAAAASRVDPLPASSSSRGDFEQILPPVNSYVDARRRNDTPPAILLPATESSISFCRPDFASSSSFHSLDGSAGAQSTDSITFARLGSGCQIISCASNPVCMTSGSVNPPCLATPFPSPFFSAAETAFSRNISTPSPSSATTVSLLNGAAVLESSPPSTIAHSDIYIDVSGAEPERASPPSVQLAASSGSSAPSPTPKQRTYPGCSTIRYNRRRRNQVHDSGQEEDDKRRVHFCDYPGEFNASIVLPSKQIN